MRELSEVVLVCSSVQVHCVVLALVHSWCVLKSRAFDCMMAIAHELGFVDKNSGGVMFLFTWALKRCTKSQQKLPSILGLQRNVW